MAEAPVVRLRGEAGSHTAYFGEDGRLTVEWYDFGADAPYESANLLRFDSDQERALLNGLGASPPLTPVERLAVIADALTSWFEVRRFAEANGIGFDHAVDFQP